MSKKKKTKAKSNTKTSNKGKILYWIAAIVILIPLLLLGWIYLNAKESSGKPTVGSRFDNSLNPPITEEMLNEVKDTVKYDNADNIEINLISATLRVNIDTADNASSNDIKNIMNDAYKKVDSIIPIDTYFTNNDSDKMYDLEVHVYNYIPDEEHSADDQIYMIKTKTAAAKKPNVSTPSSPKNKTVANELLKEEKEEKE